MDILMQDIRFAFRMLVKWPGFAFVAIITLALGIGVNSSIFSIINTLMFRPLPVKQPERLVVLGTQDQQLEFPYELSYPDYLSYKEQKDVFADLIAYVGTTMSLNTQGRTERIWVEETTGNYFAMLGVEAAGGRLYSTDEEEPPMAYPVMVLGYSFWQRHYGSDPSVIGRTVRLERQLVTIIGVVPNGFTGTESLVEPEAYVPFNQVWTGRVEQLTKRGERSFNVMGRLQPGVSLERAKAALDVVAKRLAQEFPESNKGVSMAIAPELQARPRIAVASTMPIIAAIFMSLAGLVLLITCANVANLMVSRSISRQKEISIRTALGATRQRLIRQLLTESTIIALLGGSGGILLAYWTTNLVATIRPDVDAPVNFDLSMDWRVFTFTLLAAILTGIVSGLMPAFQASRTNLQELLKEGGRTSAGPGRQRVRRLLVGAQVAVSVVLLISAGLFVRSLQNAEKVQFGFDINNLLLMTMDVGQRNFPEERGRQFYQQLIERTRTMPQVASAAIAYTVPFGYLNEMQDVYIEGQELSRESERLRILETVIGLDYFNTMGVPVVQGRDFTEQDIPTSPKVAIISEAMAKRFWPGQDPLGKRFKIGDAADFLRIVGVAKDSKYLFLTEEPRAFFYLPQAQNYRPSMTLLVKTHGDPMNLAVPVRQFIQQMESDVPVYDVKSMTSHILHGKELLLVRLAASVAAAFGFLGLLLAIVGLYGVISYSVNQRVHEIGLRVALGARPSDILKLIIGQGMRISVVGLLIGLGIASAITRVLTSMLYGIQAMDVLTFTGVSLLIAMAAFLACYLPARRATKVDPMVALREN